MSPRSTSRPPTGQAHTQARCDPQPRHGADDHGLQGRRSGNARNPEGRRPNPVQRRARRWCDRGDTCQATPIGDARTGIAIAGTRGSQVLARGTGQNTASPGVSRGTGKQYAACSTRGDAGPSALGTRFSRLGRPLRRSLALAVVGGCCLRSQVGYAGTLNASPCTNSSSCRAAEVTPGPGTRPLSQG